jgi:hypothetical protein
MTLVTGAEFFSFPYLAFLSVQKRNDFTDFFNESSVFPVHRLHFGTHLLEIPVTLWNRALEDMLPNYKKRLAHAPTGLLHFQAPVVQACSTVR